MNKEREKYARGFIEVDLDKIIANARNIKNHIKQGTKIIAVIKTDGYGHGSVPIAKALEKESIIYGYAVATEEEALELIEAGITLPVIILGYTFPYAYEEMAKKGIEPAVFRSDMVKRMGEAAMKMKTKMKVHIKVDTGMGRIGVLPDEAGFDFVKQTMDTEGIEIAGIFTHFTRADEEDITTATMQYNKFIEFVSRIEKELGLTNVLKHCSNSAGILQVPNADMDAVRAGIGLYGLYPSKEVKLNGVELYPALSFYSTIVFIKDMPAGCPISYGGTYVTTKMTKVATIPVGYGDGYPRSLSNKGYVLIHGKKAPILGRVCMDQMMVDVTDISEVREGDKVTLIGKDGEEELSANYLGDISGRFNYELVCDLGKRIPRLYIGG